MSDVFREVDEAVREDRVRRLWKRYGWLVITVAAVLVLGAATYVAWQNYEARRNSEYSAALAAALARGGRVIFLSDGPGIAKLGDMAAATIELPQVDPFVAPILYTIPVQLLAYHVAVHKGTDVDQPRNLAKSVTVE